MADYSGSAGNDQYFGTPEADRILGLQGQDQLRGGAGDDFLSGGSGPDALYGDVGDDRIEGGSGDDVVRGGRGADTIHGGEGTDVLFGDRDDDVLSGDEGDDVLFGGPGDDTFHGGAGSDIVHGGSGTDTVDYGNSSAPIVVSLNSYDPQSGGHAEGDLLLAIENVLGSPGDDLITGSAAAVNHLDGRGGDDRLVLQQGGTLVGGPGDDTFVFRARGARRGRDSGLHEGRGQDRHRVRLLRRRSQLRRGRREPSRGAAGRQRGECAGLQPARSRVRRLRQRHAQRARLDAGHLGLPPRIDSADRPVRAVTRTILGPARVFCSQRVSRQVVAGGLTFCPHGYDTPVCPEHQLIVIACDGDTTFGILHTRFPRLGCSHELWL